MDSALQSSSENKSHDNFMKCLRIRQNSRRSKSFCESDLDPNAQMARNLFLNDGRPTSVFPRDAQIPSDLMVTEGRPIAGINGHLHRPAAMIVASQPVDAFSRTPMRVTSNSWPSMQATPRAPMRTTSTPTPTPTRPLMQATPKSNFLIRSIVEAKPQNVPMRKASVPSLMGMSIPNIHLPIAETEHQKQNGASGSRNLVNLCTYCRSLGERYHYGHTNKNCPKLASMPPCHRCGARGMANHTDTYCPANKTMLRLKRNKEEHQLYISNIKKDPETDE